MGRVSYKKKISREVFTPSRQSDEELRLANGHPSVVCETLGAMLTEERRNTIGNAINNRTKVLHVAVEGVHDPHNTAAIIRTADAYGILNVHIIEGAAKFKSSIAVTQGSHKWIDVRVYENTEHFVQSMRDRDIKILVAAMDGAIPIGQVNTDQPTVLVFGNESEGISDQMFELADGAFKIPMFGFVESFNVSVAAAISISSLRKDGGGDLSSSEKEILTARYYLRSVRAGAEIVKRSLNKSTN